jgi:hypothetical protein
MRLWIFVALAACSSTPAAPPHPSEKPSAPVTVSIDDRDLGGGDHEITLTATPTVDIAALTLTLDGRDVSLGATAQGQTRTIATRVHLAPGDGRDVIGGVTAGHRNRAAVVHIGAAVEQASRPATTYQLPDGTRVEEVRP